MYLHIQEAYILLKVIFLLLENKKVAVERKTEFQTKINEKLEYCRVQDVKRNKQKSKTLEWTTGRLSREPLSDVCHGSGAEGEAAQPG